MKRKLALAVALIVITIIFIRPFPERQEPPVVETRTEMPSVTVSEPEIKKAELPAAPVVEQETAVLAIEVVPEVEVPEPVLETPAADEPIYEEEVISIVMISVCEAEESAVQALVPVQSISNVKGFRVVGNRTDMPLDLIVKSRDAEGCEKIHFLDWNIRHPNEFKLYGALGTDTTVGIYANEVQVARFTIPADAQEEYVALDLNQGSQLAYAQ